jgi:hypothetical protein
MEPETRSVGGVGVRANVMLVGAFASLIFIIGGIVYFRADIPDGVLAILNMSCGAILTMLGSAFNFEFGSSRGSSEKSNQMADMLAKK